MTGLTGRSSMLLKANISKLLERAEDPAETLDYAYERQLEDLQNLKQAIADVVTAKKRLQSQESKLDEQTENLAEQAREAMSAGREDLARAALQRKELITSELGSLDQQVTELESAQEKLTAAEHRLRTKINAFRSNKEVVKAQYSAAEARVRIYEAATGVGDDMADIGLAMQRVLDHTETMKARAAAIEGLPATSRFQDLSVPGPAEADVDRQLEQLGMQSTVDDELAKLKKELAPLAGSAETAPRDPSKPPPETDVERCRRRPLPLMEREPDADLQAQTPDSFSTAPVRRP